MLTGKQRGSQSRTPFTPDPRGGEAEVLEHWCGRHDLRQDLRPIVTCSTRRVSDEIACRFSSPSVDLHRPKKTS